VEEVAIALQEIQCRKIPKTLSGIETGKQSANRLDPPLQPQNT